MTNQNMVKINDQTMMFPSGEPNQDANSSFLALNEPNLDDLDVSVHSHSFKHLDAGSNDDGGA